MTLHTNIEPAERALMLYTHLSWQAYQKKQISDADRLLLLAGEQACHTGKLEVSENVRKVLLSHNPHHMLAGFSTFADALRSTDFQEYLKTIHRFCSLEQAEWLLEEMHLDWERISFHDGNYWKYADFLIKDMLVKA